MAALPVIAFLLARLPWRAGTHLEGPPPDLAAAEATQPDYAALAPAEHTEGGAR